MGQYILGLSYLTCKSLINSNIAKIIFIVSYLCLKKQHVFMNIKLDCIIYLLIFIFIFKIHYSFDDRTTSLKLDGDQEHAHSSAVERLLNCKVPL